VRKRKAPPKKPGAKYYKQNRSLITPGGPIEMEDIEDNIAEDSEDLIIGPGLEESKTAAQGEIE